MSHPPKDTIDHVFLFFARCLRLNKFTSDRFSTTRLCTKRGWKTSKNTHLKPRVNYQLQGFLEISNSDQFLGFCYHHTYPLVMTNIAMENGPFIDGLPVYLLKMVIFHGYVK